MSAETNDDAVAVSAAPRTTSSSECFQSAARVLRFAETETNPVIFDQLSTLAERWMELGNIMGDSS